MRRLFAILTASLGVAGCGQPAPDSLDALRKSLAESQAVRTCPNGVIVGRDRAGRLVFLRHGPASFADHGITAGYLAPGVTADQFCGQVNSLPQEPRS